MNSQKIGPTQVRNEKFLGPLNTTYLQCSVALKISHLSQEVLVLFKMLKSSQHVQVLIDQLSAVVQDIPLCFMVPDFLSRLLSERLLVTLSVTVALASKQVLLSYVNTVKRNRSLRRKLIEKIVSTCLLLK